jgi:hypothetical protein
MPRGCSFAAAVQSKLSFAAARAEQEIARYGKRRSFRGLPVRDHPVGLKSMQIERGPGRDLLQAPTGPGWAGKRLQIDDFRSYFPPSLPPEQKLNVLKDVPCRLVSGYLAVRVGVCRAFVRVMRFACHACRLLRPKAAKAETNRITRKKSRHEPTRTAR